jgi:hypothetical protein
MSWRGADNAEVVAGNRTGVQALAADEGPPFMTKRKRYSSTFKAKLALEALREERTTPGLPVNPGLPANMGSSRR